MGITDFILTFIHDKSIRSTRKFAYLVFGLTFLFAIDYFFKFSDSYIAEKKIDQLEQIYKLRKSHQLSKNTTEELLNIEKSIINRQGFWSLSADFISLIERTINSPTQKKNKPISTNPITKEDLNIKKERSLVWHVISTNWAWLIAGIIFPVTIIKLEDGDTIEKKIALIIFFEILILIIMGLFSYITAQIPIFEKPLWNYLINASIQLLIVLTVYVIEFGSKKTSVSQK